MSKESGLSRRSFLKRVSLATAGLFLGHFAPASKAEHRNTRSSPETSANPELKENPDYRPFIKLLSSAVESYQETSGKEAYFSRSDDYRDNRDHIRNIWQKRDGLPEFYPVSPKGHSNFKEYIGSIQRNLKIWLRSFTISFLPEALSPEEKVVGVDFSSSRNIVDVINEFTFCGIVERNKSSLDLILNHFAAIRQLIETWVASNDGKPISSAKLLESYLSLNDGDLSKALWDTAFFLKFTCRNDWKNGDFLANEESARWMATNILDEFSSTSPNFNELTSQLQQNSTLFNCSLHYDLFDPYCVKDYDPVNQNGLPYHAFNLVAALSHFPWQMIVARFVVDQQQNIESYGQRKIKSDMNFIRGLPSIDQYLQKLSQ